MERLPKPLGIIKRPTEINTYFGQEGLDQNFSEREIRVVKKAR